jgi:lipopolysaccharide transport system ATP-binding protein
LALTLHFATPDGIIAFGSGMAESMGTAEPLPRGLYRGTCRIPGHLVNVGELQVSLLVIQDEGTVVYKHENLLSFVTVDGAARGGFWYGQKVGIVRPSLKWSLDPLGGESPSTAKTHSTEEVPRR